MNDQENDQAQPELVIVDQKVFSAKFGTKGEVFRFLATEAMVYLPSYQTVTIWHLKELANGTKNVGYLVLISSFSGNSL